MTETEDEVATDGIVEDIAVLARTLAKKEPFKSASGPEALLALAAHLEEMVATTRLGQRPTVSVPVQSRRKRGD